MISPRNVGFTQCHKHINHPQKVGKNDIGFIISVIRLYTYKLIYIIITINNELYTNKIFYKVPSGHQTWQWNMADL